MTFIVTIVMGTFLPKSVSPLLSTRFVNILHWVAELHDRQIREVHNIPYISHLLSVTALTVEKGTMLLPSDLLEDAAIVALMHHSVEDVGLPLELFEQIGGTVQAVMKLLCEECAFTKSGYNQRYIDRLQAATDSVGAIAHLVAAADQLDQLRFYADQGRSLWKLEQQAFYQQFLDRINIPAAWDVEMKRLLEGLQVSAECFTASNAVPSLRAATAALPSLPTGYCPA